METIYSGLNSGHSSGRNSNRSGRNGRNGRPSSHYRPSSSSGRNRSSSGRNNGRNSSGSYSRSSGLNRNINRSGRNSSGSYSRSSGLNRNSNRSGRNSSGSYSRSSGYNSISSTSSNNINQNYYRPLQFHSDPYNPYNPSRNLHSSASYGSDNSSITNSDLDYELAKIFEDIAKQWCKSNYGWYKEHTMSNKPSYLLYLNKVIKIDNIIAKSSKGCILDDSSSRLDFNNHLHLQVGTTNRGIVTQKYVTDDDTNSVGHLCIFNDIYNTVIKKYKTIKEITDEIYFNSGYNKFSLNKSNQISYKIKDDFFKELNYNLNTNIYYYSNYICNGDILAFERKTSQKRGYYGNNRPSSRPSTIKRPQPSYSKV